MNAEARAWSVAPVDPDGNAVLVAPSVRGGALGATSVQRPHRPTKRRSEVIEREAEDVSWNVLAEELVPFPVSARRVRFEERSGADGRTDLSPHDREDADCSRRYGEAWLQRELIALRYRADAGYPALDRRVLSPARPPVGAELATATPATARATHHLDISNPERRARSVGEVAQTRAAAADEPRGLRRLLPGVATLAVLAGLWAGAGMLAAAQRPPLAVLPGSVKTPAGYVYVVRPGDTLWSIATRLRPGGDPRVLVEELQSQVRGATLVPGSRLRLP